MLDTCNIKVAIRVRSLIEKELQHGQKCHWTIKDDSICCDETDNGRKCTPYTFDQIFDQQSVTMDVFEDICKPIVDSALDGIHGTIFAYGQSSSGKTFTMSGTKMQPGVITLAIQEIFSKITNIEHKEFLIRVGYMEIYNEQVTDLLSAEENILKIREDSDHNIQISGLKEDIVNSLDQVMAVIKRGDAKRHTAETKQNDRSSRSHCILRFVIESRTVGTDDEPVNLSHLYFVDLAGSEKAADNTGDRFKEGCAINKSLFTLGNVIRKLSGDENMTHVSFRDSKLTRLLQNALGGNSKTAIICTITPAAIEESDSTLKFASRAKIIKNRPEVNEVMTDAALLKKYRREINMLQNKMKELNNTDMHMEKAELEKQLIEKEEVQKKQAQLILKLQEMVVISGVDNNKEPPKKRRRETWCPGKATRGLTEKNFLPVIEEISPPNKSACSEVFTLSRTVPNTQPDLDTSLQLLDEVPAYRATMAAPVDDTIKSNPYIKELFELQDKHEILLEEMKKKDQELEEMREFTELERECEKEAIKNLTEKLKAYESSIPWLEEELMKTQQERNRLRAEVELKGQQLSAVEDGSGLTQKNQQLTESEAKITSLGSEMDIQKTRYEFHLAQMKAKLEAYTQLLEENGVNPELIKQKTGADTGYGNEVDELLAKHEQEVNDLRLEVDSYVQRLEKEEAKNVDLIQHFEAQLEQQKEMYQKDLQDIKDESEVFRQMFEEERARSAQNPAESETSINSLKQIHNDEIDKLRLELNTYVALLEKEKLKSEIGMENEKVAEMETMKQKQENEMNTVKAELENCEELLQTQRENNMIEVSGSVVIDFKSDIEVLKQAHQIEITNLKAELEKYIKLSEDERMDSCTIIGENIDVSVKSEMETMLTRYEEEITALKAEVHLLRSETEESREMPGESLENSIKLSIETMKEKYEEEIDDLKAEVNKYIELLYVERQKSSTEKIESADSNLRLEIEMLKENHEDQVKNLRAEIERYIELLEARQEVHSDIREKIQTDLSTKQLEIEKTRLEQRDEMEVVNDIMDEQMEISNVKQASLSPINQYDKEAEIEKVKQKYEAEIQELKAELSQYMELVTADRECFNANESLNLNSEILKAEYEEKIKTLEEDLETYKELLIEEQKKNKATEAENDVSIDNFTPASNEVLSCAKEAVDIQTELLRAEKDASDYSAQDDLRSEVFASDLEELKQTHKKEILDLKAELQKYVDLLEIERQKSNSYQGEESDSEKPQSETRLASQENSEGPDQSMATLKSELEKHIQLLEEQRQQNKHLEDVHREESATFDQQRSIYENTIKEIEEELHNVGATTQQLSTEIERLEKVNRSLKNDKLSLVNQLSEMETESEKLNQVDPDSESKYQELLENFAKVNSENLLLSNKLQEADVQVDSISSDNRCLNEKVQELSAKVDNLIEVKCEIEEKSQAQLGEIKRLNTVSEGLSEELKVATARSQTLSDEVDKLEKINRELQDSEQNVGNIREEVDLQIGKLEELNHSLENRSQELQAEVENQEKLIDSLRQENIEVKNEKTSIQTKVECLEAANTSLTNETKKLAAVMESLEGVIDSLKEENKTSLFVKEESERKVEVYEETLQELKAELQLQEEENINLRNSLEQKTSDALSTDSELEFLKTHVNELEDDAKVSAELIAEYDTEVKQLREKLVTLESSKIDDKLELQEKYNICVAERDEIAKKLREVESSHERILEKIREEHDANVSSLTDRIDSLLMQLNRLKEEMICEDELIKVKVEFEEKLNVCVSERDSLQKQLKLLEETSVSKETVKQIKKDCEEKQSVLEIEKEELLKQLTDLRKETTDRESIERVELDLKDKLQAAECELNELRRKTSLLEEEKSTSEKVVEKLEEEKKSLEEDLYQAEKKQPKQTLRINTVGSNEEWEKKWSDFVRDEKRKRVGLMYEIRDLKLELKQETERRENSLEEAMELAREEIRKQDMYQKLMEDFRKTDNEANKLHSDLEDEKKVTKQLQLRLDEEKKVTEDLKQTVDTLEKKLKSSSANGFVEASHSCNYKLESFSLQRKLKENEDVYKQRFAEYEDTVQMQEARIAKLKNEIRRMQTMDTTINFKASSKLDLNDSTPSSAKKPKTDISGCGSSSSGGIIDHFKVLITETENKRLKKEVEKQAAKLEGQASKLLKYEQLEKENISLKEELKKTLKTKTKTEENEQTSIPRHPLGDVIKKVGDTLESSSHSNPSAQKRKPRFEIPDTEPKKSDGRFIVDGEDMQEKVDNCKSQ